jgi:hypothetical protein
MKYTDTELEKTLNELGKATYAGEVDVVDKVMNRLKEAENKEKFSIQKERKVRWTIGTMSLAAASVALLLFIGNSSSSQAQNENDGMAKFISEIYNRQSQADVVYYTPDYIDILLGIEGMDENI